MKRKTFLKGKPFKSLCELSKAIERGEWVFFLERPKHPSFIDSMQIRFVRTHIGMFFRARREAE